MTKTKIEWSDEVWNPVVGCTKVSPGCDHCYAERITERFHGKGSFAEVKLHPERLDAPLRWRKPRRVFVNSMSDLFHQDVPDEFIARVFAVMAATPQHTFQILTKRHGRLRSLLRSGSFNELMMDGARQMYYQEGVRLPGDLHWSWPLSNVWLGVSVEDQQRADLRIPALLDTPAAVRFLSCEPLLGPVDLTGPVDQYGGRPRLTYWLTGSPSWGEAETNDPYKAITQPLTISPRIDWVICGGESGPGARPMHPDWARSLRDQCTAAGVPYFLKQWGGHSPKAGGRELDGRTWDEYPREQVLT